MNVAISVAFWFVLLDLRFNVLSVSGPGYIDVDSCTFRFYVFHMLYPLLSKCSICFQVPKNARYYNATFMGLMRCLSFGSSC